MSDIVRSLVPSLARDPLPCTALVRPLPRWHLDYLPQRDGSTLVVVMRRCGAAVLPSIVRPTLPGLRAAATLADALNRAYGIEPVSGFDVSGLTGLDLGAAPVGDPARVAARIAARVASRVHSAAPAPH